MFRHSPTIHETLTKYRLNFVFCSNRRNRCWQLQQTKFNCGRLQKILKQTLDLLASRYQNLTWRLPTVTNILPSSVNAMSWTCSHKMYFISFTKSLYQTPSVRVSRHHLRQPEWTDEATGYLSRHLVAGNFEVTFPVPDVHHHVVLRSYGDDVLQVRRECLSLVHSNNFKLSHINIFFT